MSEVNYSKHLDMDANSLIIYDGDCGFCEAVVKSWVKLPGPPLQIRTFQSVAKTELSISGNDLRREIHYIDPQGGVWRGAAAVYKIFELKNVGLPYRFFFKNFPGGERISQWGYRLVARYRLHISRILNQKPDSGNSCSL